MTELMTSTAFRACVHIGEVQKSRSTQEVGHIHAYIYVGLARTIYIRFINGIFAVVSSNIINSVF